MQISMLMERTEKSTNSMEMRIGLWFAATAHNSFNMIILQFYTIKKCMYFYSQYTLCLQPTRFSHCTLRISTFAAFVMHFHVCVWERVCVLCLCDNFVPSFLLEAVFSLLGIPFWLHFIIFTHVFNMKINAKMYTRFVLLPWIYFALTIYTMFVFASDSFLFFPLSLLYLCMLFCSYFVSRVVYAFVQTISWFSLRILFTSFVMRLAKNVQIVVVTVVVFLVPPTSCMYLLFLLDNFQKLTYCEHFIYSIYDFS